METAGTLGEEEQLKEALKERGLGTPATRAAIIETLIDRGYITRDKKTLAATDLGRYLVAMVQDRSLKSPELTGDWEAKLRQVERGALDRRRFMAEIVRYTEDLIRSGSATTVDPSRLGDCPRCGRPVIEGRRGYGCSGWREGCPFVLWREFQGRTLTEGQIRELLQRHVLLDPLTIDGTGALVLQLLDSGDLAGIPVPTGRPLAGSKPSRGGRGSRRTPGRRTSSRADKGDPVAPRHDVGGEPRARRSRPKNPELVEGASAKSGGGFRSVALGACPLCGSDVVEQEKSFGCSGWREGCRFAIWKTMAGKAIGARTAQALLRRGTTPLLRSFRSKAGNRFDARLKLEGGEVRFDFDKDDRRRAPRSPDAV
jgi:DNA topoisomerase-3